MPIQKPTTKVLPKLVSITPYELYIRQVSGTYDNLRAQNAGIDYIPPQFGGLFGQRKTLEDEIVLEIIDFDIK
jgi:hypothetical protein